MGWYIGLVLVDTLFSENVRHCVISIRQCSCDGWGVAVKDDEDG